MCIQDFKSPSSSTSSSSSFLLATFREPASNVSEFDAAQKFLRRNDLEKEDEVTVLGFFRVEIETLEWSRRGRFREEERIEDQIMHLSCKEPTSILGPGLGLGLGFEITIEVEEGSGVSRASVLIGIKIFWSSRLWIRAVKGKWGLRSWVSSDWREAKIFLCFYLGVGLQSSTYLNCKFKFFFFFGRKKNMNNLCQYYNYSDSLHQKYLRKYSLEKEKENEIHKIDKIFYIFKLFE